MIHLLVALAVACAAPGPRAFAAAPISPELTREIRVSTEREVQGRGQYGSRARGYAILIAAMVVAAAATSYLSSILPARMQFMSYFVSQVSTLGVYVFGAPIWEPLASGFRKTAFGVDASSVEAKDDELENLWRRTQRAYSLNEQMSRNVITSFLISAKQNFYQAHRAMISNEPYYAAEQIAEAAVRLRLYFADISPRDESVAAAIRSAFTDHVRVDEAFRGLVIDAIARLDPETRDIEATYAEVLTTWLARAPVAHSDFSRKVR